MDISAAWRKGKLVALGALMACGLLGGTAFAADTTSDGIGIQSNRSAAIVHTDSSSTGFELQYFHAYKASKTYAIGLKNGLGASFDFEHGTVTLYAQSGTTTTFPLEQVLLQANNGNAQAATEMYDQLYQSITAAHSDAITSEAGPGSAATYGLPRRWGGIGGFGGPLWSTPTGGACWPIPAFCQPWPGGLSDWGAYNNWWAGAFGDPPPSRRIRTGAHQMTSIANSGSMIGKTHVTMWQGTRLGPTLWPGSRERHVHWQKRGPVQLVVPLHLPAA